MSLKQTSIFYLKKGLTNQNRDYLHMEILKVQHQKTGWENSHEKRIFVFARNASSIISGYIMFKKHNMTFFKKKVLHILKCIPTLLTFCITTKGLADGHITQCIKLEQGQ